MERNRHKRKNSHVVIVTSDAADVGVRHFRIRPWMLQTVIIILCVIIGALIGLFVYEENIWAGRFQQTEAQSGTIAKLEQEKAELEKQSDALENQVGTLEGQIDSLNQEIDGLNQEIASLNERVKILSGTVEQKIQTENDLRAQIDGQYLPTELPLTGTVSMGDQTEGEEPICVFNVAEGSMVVATARGTVRAVNDDPEYGHNIWVDHGNGYTTIYRSQGDVKVKQGETVAQGATLLLITQDNGRVGYQMMKDGVYIDPMDMLEISG